MNVGWLTGVVTLLLGAGGATFVTTVVRGWGTLRSGARAREREAVDDLGRWRDESDERRRLAEADRDFWRQLAARRAAQLARAGIDIPDDPLPPSERAHHPGGKQP